MTAKKNHLFLKTGLGVAAVAAAAGAYYFFGQNGDKHRKSAQAWVDKAKKDVLVEIKKLKNLNEQTYNSVAGKVLDKYAKFKKENPETFALLTKELKNHWPNIKKHLPKPIRKIVGSTKPKKID
jgi:gas vesicle protein